MSTITSRFLGFLQVPPLQKEKFFPLQNSLSTYRKLFKSIVPKSVRGNCSRKKWLDVFCTSLQMAINQISSTGRHFIDELERKERGSHTEHRLFKENRIFHKA